MIIDCYILRLRLKRIILGEHYNRLSSIFIHSIRGDIVQALEDVIGAIPVYMGLNSYLLLIAKNGLILVAPKRDLLKEILASPLTLTRYVRTRAIVELSKKDPQELLNLLNNKGYKTIEFIKRELIKYVEFKRKLFGQGVIAMTIHTIDGKKYNFNLIYGPGKGINKDEAIGNAISKLESLGITIIKKI